MFVNGSIRNEQSLQRTFHRYFFPSFISFGQAVSEEKLFQKLTNKNKNCLRLSYLLTDRDEISNLYRGPSMMLPTTFWSIQPSCFRVEEFQKSANQKQELPVAAMFVNGSGLNEQFLQRAFHRCFLPSFGSFCKAVSEEKIFLEISKSETRIVCGGHVC